MENTNETPVNEELTTVDGSDKKNQRKFNGFLRNNHHKKQAKKPTPDMHLKSHPNQHHKKSPTNVSKDSEENIEIINKIIEPKQSQEEYAVFSFLRLKTGYNEKNFWDNLNKILQEKSFSNIKKSNYSLISYAVLHDSTIVYDKLLEKFGSEVSQEEFVNCIFKFGIHKNPELVNSSLKFYTQHFNIENNFLNQLITDLSKVSYRLETNHLFLSWIAPRLNSDLLKCFWDNAISHNNVPIILQSLEYKEYSQYLSSHFSEYEKSLESIGRLTEIKRILYGNKIFKKVDDLNESVIINKEGLSNDQSFEPTIWLSDKVEQFKVIQENLSDKKPTEVIVKKKRKIA